MFLQKYRGLDAQSLDTTVRVYTNLYEPSTATVTIRTTGFGRDIVRFLFRFARDNIDRLCADLQRWQEGVSIQDAFSGVPAFKKVISDPYFGLAPTTIIQHQTTALPVPLLQVIYSMEDPMDNREMHRYIIKKPAGDTIVELQEDGTILVTTAGMGMNTMRLFDNPYLEDMATLHAGLQKWRDGEVIQDAFPDASTNFREALVNPFFGFTDKEQADYFFLGKPMVAAKKISLEIDGTLEREERAIELVEAFLDVQGDETYDENGDFTQEAEDYLSDVLGFMKEVLSDGT